MIAMVVNERVLIPFLAVYSYIRQWMQYILQMVQTQANPPQYHATDKHDIPSNHIILTLSQLALR